jgi:hypothetical protein
MSENIGIQPIHIRFSTNMNDDKSQLFTKSMIYKPPKEEKPEEQEESPNAENFTEYPLFTNNSKLPLNTILKLPPDAQKDLFFSPLAFKKLIGTKVENDKEVRIKNAQDNFIILLNILFPTSFPIRSNLRETFSENIQDTIVDIGIPDDNIFSPITDIFQQRENKYAYCTFNNEPCTISKITFINDIINDPIFSELIQISTNFQIIRQKKIDEYKKKADDLFNSIKKNIASNLTTIQTAFKTEDTPVNDMYKKVINKRSNINFQAKHPPSLMEPYLKSIIDEDKSNTEDIINTFVKLYELKEVSTDPNYIPFTFTKLPGFSNLLNDSFNYYMQKQILDSITQLNIANGYLKKEKEDSKSLTSIEKKIISVLKSFNIFDTFLKTMQKFKNPNRSYTNEYLSKIINNSETEMDEYIKFIDYINKINKEERPSDEVLNNDFMKDKLQTGVMTVQDNIQPENTEKKENIQDPLRSTTKKHYDVMVNYELIKGILNDENLDDIKCPYKDEYLVELYNNLKYADQKNPVLFYNKFKVFDMAKYAKNNTEKKSPSMKGGYPAKGANNNNKKKGGYPKTRRNRRRRQNKTIRSIHNSQRLTIN